MLQGGHGSCQLELPKQGLRSWCYRSGDQPGTGREAEVSRVGAGRTGREAGPRALRGTRLWQWLRGWGVRSPKSGVYSRD